MTPDPLTIAAAEQARTVVLQMMAERGRGVVLVGAARLDLAVEHLLKAVMAPSQDTDDRLFTPERSLGSFAAKITLAARLGLIDSSIEASLHAVRSVRNDFAHSAGEPSLADARHQKRLRRVYPEAEASPLWLALAPLLAQQSGLSSHEQAFILLVTILVASIEACVLLQVPFTPRATVRFRTS
ncbi:DUF4145 domain-containing protein [Synechococcus sp. CBW1004]|uniref:DUF4145 domain-containing protein n=1 Tax=Synechococcus sp. CBW1004 TaxID=1353136 RepID=UPI0018CE2916|nr:DUF4145 domain-containing protein [Synechococcus sp. CBW1004]QPN64627.1 hypothetical protein H8F25_07905 [Synechococcus sp. CBW1004]